MIKFLNNVVKGLLVALVVITLGGFVALNLKTVPATVMVLVSSSVVNSINTSELKDLETDEKIDEEVFDEKDSETEVEVFEEEESKDVMEVVTPPVKEEVVNPPVKEEVKPPVKEEIKVPEVIVQGEYRPNLEVLNTVEVLATYHGKMTAYGPDCVGCSGITASGRNVLNGNIYYDDPTFGSIRIVAGDRSIPFGSIIKITGINISTEPVIAIVLDRGGMIGFQEGKHAYFDLLYKSEADTLPFGRQDATFELLRSGY